MALLSLISFFDQNLLLEAIFVIQPVLGQFLGPSEMFYSVEPRFTINVKGDDQNEQFFSFSFDKIVDRCEQFRLLLILFVLRFLG